MSQNRTVILFYLQQSKQGLSEKEIIKHCYPDYGNYKWRKSRGGWAGAIYRQLHYLTLSGLIKMEQARKYFIK